MDKQLEYLTGEIAEYFSLTNMDIEPEVLTKTVEQYNTACSTYNDELFGRVQFSDGSEIVSGSFYATPLRPVAYITIGV